MVQAKAWAIPGCGATDEPCSRKHPFPCSGIYWRERGDHLKFKFILSICFGGLWLAVSLFFAIGWAQEVSYIFPSVYVWWVIIGIALLPGFLMSAMFFSNLLHWKLKRYPDIAEDTTILMCAHNEEKNIARSIQAILNQQYAGRIRLIVVDNGSNDHTKQQIMNMQTAALTNCSIEYVYCDQPGKAHALNYGLAMIHTPHFITVDADTYLQKQAVQRIMNHIVSCGSVCVAGNLFVQNAKASLAARMQNYDYLLSIAAIKRFQGSYQSTLVAQGAFSAYQTEAVQQSKLGEEHSPLLVRKSEFPFDFNVFFCSMDNLNQHIHNHPFVVQRKIFPFA